MSDSAASILIVDDEQLNLDMLSRRLRRSGFAVEVAASGREALETVRQQSFDLILLDQMMPELSGADVLRILREEYPCEVLPIIMVTAVAESDKIAEALENGANDYITKPIDFAVALARIRSQLARKRAETALRQSEERYALAAEASQDGLWDWNLVSQQVYYSPRWKRMLGLTPAEQEHPLHSSSTEGSSPDVWFSRILSADREMTKTAIDEYVQGSGDILQCSYRIRHADGSVRWMTCRGIVTRDERGIPVRLAGSQSDVTDEKTRDVLTGLPNRLPILGHLECALERASHTCEIDAPKDFPSHALLFLDLDGFKTINDSLGHVAGDRLLRLVSDRLRVVASAYASMSVLPVQAQLARMGGDEFAVLLQGTITHETAMDFASCIRQAMAAPFELDGRNVHCIFSIGIALASALHLRPEDILRDADIAMYTAKLRGRGEIVAFKPEMHDAAGLQFELETGIWMAAERNELVVMYQPKVDLASGLTYGVEALVRWNHPTRGLLQPGIFIPVGEKTGAIIEIGRWTLREACRQVRSWHEAFPASPPLELSVNLSPREFKQENLVEEIGRILMETGFPASSLHLEITESVLFEDMAAARAVLFALKEMGIGLEIDDFGSGYSSLRYLRELPFDFLKIDRYFTANLESENSSTEELIETIITMANNLGLQVVAEGIETEPHSAKLQKLGCRFGQGFYFSRPVASDAMRTLLDANYAAIGDGSSLASISPSVLLLGSPEAV
jgi:diguanylate cyclase (GGDEF)-like protein/PAS domain S-box-containing protein